MGAALTVVTPRVLEMLDRRAKQKTNITEQELQAIAKAMYEERLVEVCTVQRSTPYDVQTHSAANLALIDYFERLKNLGGRLSFLPAEERKLEAEGWSAGAPNGSPTCVRSLPYGRSKRSCRSGRTRSIAILPPPVSRSMTGCAGCWSLRHASADAWATNVQTRCCSTRPRSSDADGMATRL